MIHDFQIADRAASKRLDLFLAAALKISRNQVQKQIDAGRAVVNGTPQKASYLIEPGDKISFEPADTPVAVIHEAPSLPIVYEDADLLVVDKPAGLSMHPGSGQSGPTVADFARLHSSDPDLDRPGIVHRLDKETSGLVVIAKTKESKAYLQSLFKRHLVQKTYLALVTGRPDPPEATIKLPLGRDPKHPLRQAAAPGGREAETRYKSVASFPGFTLVEAYPATGRTHQIRVHFATLGHPVAGDSLYAPGQILPKGLKRLFLHAVRLEFTSPNGHIIAVVSTPPPDLDAVLGTLSNSR